MRKIECVHTLKKMITINIKSRVKLVENYKKY